MDTKLVVVPTTVSLSFLLFNRLPRSSNRLVLSLRRAMRLTPDKLFFDHPRQVVVAVMMLEDLDQLGIRSRLNRNDSSVLGFADDAGEEPHGPALPTHLEPVAVIKTLFDQRYCLQMLSR
jgi:hypothetical protein